MEYIEEGTIAVVTTKSGYRYVAEWFDAHIDFIWLPLIRPDKRAYNQLVDPDVSFEIVGVKNKDE